MKYYSDLTKKLYDSEEELAQAEEKLELEKKEKEAKIADRKADAEKVKEAIKARVNAEFAAKNARNEAYKNYLEALDKIASQVEEARKAETDAFKVFCEKYPEGFHDTVQIGDVTWKYDYSTTGSSSYLSPFIKLLELF